MDFYSFEADVHAMTQRLDTSKSRIGALLAEIDTEDVATEAELGVIMAKDKERLERVNKATLTARIGATKIKESKAKVQRLRRGE